MKPTQRYCDPEYVEYNGEKYPIKTDYRVGLRALELVNNAKISDFERVYGMIYLLFGIIPQGEEMTRFFFEKGRLYLQCGEDDEVHRSRPKDIDFSYDFGSIEASFQSDYGIDLQTAKMSWWRFIRLISGFTEQSVMSRIRQLRNLDLSEYKDPKTREKMARAKREVAFEEEMTPEEKAMIEQFNSL